MMYHTLLMQEISVSILFSFLLLFDDKLMEMFFWPDCKFLLLLTYCPNSACSRDEAVTASRFDLWPYRVRRRSRAPVDLDHETAAMRKHLLSRGTSSGKLKRTSLQFTANRNVSFGVRSRNKICVICWLTMRYFEVHASCACACNIKNGFIFIMSNLTLVKKSKK